MGEPPRRCSNCGQSYAEGVIFCPHDGTAVTARSVDQGPDPHLGRTLQGEFRVDALIGVGTVGRVYRAHQMGVERSVALKIMHRDLAANEALRGRFRREARIAGSLCHPHVVNVLSLAELEQDGLRIPFLALEYLDGLSLRSTLAAQGALSVERTRHILLQIADAVGEAHRHGIVHRDLKPENVMLVQRGNDPDFVKVLDFGVARADVGVDARSIATHAGAIFGSPRYVAPECASGGDSSPASDVYALATLGYECLTGVTPFDGDNAIQILLKQQSAAVPALCSRTALEPIPDDLASLIERNLSKDPGMRDADAQIFARQLKAPPEAVATPEQSLAMRTRRGHAVPNEPLANANANANSSRLPAPGRRTLVVLLCFLLGAGTALGIATRLGAFSQRPAATPEQPKVVRP